MRNAPTNSPTFTETSLPTAIGNLFKMNNYDVEYDVHVHGAQIDIVATSKGDPFSKPVYIEATIEYVANDKYGKDTTKFLLLAKKDPGCHLLCVSSRGFTADVKERAKESGVTAIDYSELFARFEKFSPYLDKILFDTSVINLTRTYEEPLFNDSKGIEEATKWLSYWKGYAPDEAKWLIILGEYGTGKTSLTKVLQYRWLSDYHANPSAPIPVRIELKNFSRQFDANGLLHHFLDNNGLSHVPIEFMTHLIRTGRVILLLDGYDEMAQFMNNRERRACLSALAELAKDGAKGILTSRPNYFSETEELSVFEALYRKLEQQKYHLSKSDSEAILQEKAIDSLIERYVLDRFERSLQDLTPEQTESLVRRTLKKNPNGQKIVLGILSRVFREKPQGGKQALSGKPVIIAYLLELVSDLEADTKDLTVDDLTEWQIYKLIVDRLMLRDFTRSPLMPNDRRKALQKLALKLSTRGIVVATESAFLEIVDDLFNSELRRMAPDERRTRRLELFEDLRSSATLTRAVGGKEDAWSFSHNSLREFLTVEMFVESLLARTPSPITVPVSEAMRSFVASMHQEEICSLWQLLGEQWGRRSMDDGIGGYLTLLWDSAPHLTGEYDEALASIGTDASTIPLNEVTVKEIDFSRLRKEDSRAVNAARSSLADIKFDGLNLARSNFSNTIADSVSFRDTDLSYSTFQESLLFECDFSGATLDEANFEYLDRLSSIIIIDEGGAPTQLVGDEAIGYLKFNGANTSPVDDIFVYCHHPRFSILKKICEKVSEQRNSQLRGLTQRGESRVDPPFARALVDRLVGLGWVTIDQNDLVSATPTGRPILQRVAATEAIAAELVQLLRDYSE